jgi:hypothetical protein
MKKMHSKKHPLIPDFLIIGAGKSGTTSLDNYLKQHPEIFIPKVKEPNFYGYEQANPEDFKGSYEELNHYNTSVTKLDDYLKLFEAAKPGQVKGETSNTYLYHSTAAERIYHYNPDMKLIAVLRQPAGRLYSRFMHLARENRTPTESFADCMNRDTIWWKRNDLIKEGFYFKNLSKFYEIFPKENIRVYLYEEFNTQPEKVLKDIYNFLGVDTEFKTNFSVKYNQSGFIRNKFLDRLYGQKGLVSQAVKTLLPMSVVNTLKKNIFVQKQLNELRSGNLVKPKLDSKLRSQLTNEVYGEDIKKLQHLIGRDLSHWFEAKS